MYPSPHIAFTIVRQVAEAKSAASDIVIVGVNAKIDAAFASRCSGVLWGRYPVRSQSSNPPAVKSIVRATVTSSDSSAIGTRSAT